MPSTPLLLGFSVQQPAGTNRSDIQVVARNENTSQSQTDNTASDGKVIFNLGSNKNFSSGWNVGDKISVSSIYQGFEQKFSFTIPASNVSIVLKDNSDATVGSFTGGSGMDTGTLVLLAVPVSPSLKYFTIQEFTDYYNIKTKDVDAENGIESLQITRIGQMVEEGIENDTNSRFDDNNGAFYTPADIGREFPEFHDVTYFNKSEYYLRFGPVNEVTVFAVNNNEEGNLQVFEDLQFLQIDNLDGTSGWSASTDGSVTVQSTPANITEGAGALNLIKSGATVAAVTYSKSFSTAYDFTDKQLLVDYFIADNTDLAVTDAVELRFGQDASNYYSQTFNRLDIGNNQYSSPGFKRLDAGVTTTGTPTPTGVVYFAIVVTAVTSGTTIASGDQRLDDLRLNTRNRIALDPNTGRIKITNSSDFAQVGSRHVRVTYNFGLSRIPHDIKNLAIIETGRKIMGAQFITNKTREFNDIDLGDLTNFENFRMRIIRKYKKQVFLPS